MAKAIIADTASTEPKPLKPINIGNAYVADNPSLQNLAPIEGKASSEKYTRGFIPLFANEEKDFTASQQKGLDEFGNMLGQTLIGAATGTIETVAYLGDLEERLGNRLTEEKEYHNWVADLMQQVKQAGKEALPIYTSKANDGFNPSSSEWWSFHGGDTIGTVLGLMLPGLGVAKAAKALGAGATGQAIAATIASRTAESTMEANETFKTSYATLIDKGYSPEAAKGLAGQAASKVWDTNWLFATQDFLQFSTLTKGVNKALKASKGSTLKSIGTLGTGVASEGLEEGGQYVVSKEAQGSVVGQDYFGEGFAKRLGDYIEEDEFKTSVLLGMAGGAVFQGAGKLAGKPFEAVTEKLKQTVKRGLEIELFDSKGDTASKEKAQDLMGADVLLTNLEKGTINEFIADVNKLNGTVEDNDQREYNNNLVKDAENLSALQTKLKTDKNNTPELIKKVLLTTLERDQIVRSNKKLTNELNNTFSKLNETNELPVEVTALKRLQLQVSAYEKLAQTQPQFAPKRDALTAKFKEEFTKYQAHLATMGAPFTEKELTTSKDDELKEKTFQAISNQEKQAVLNEELKSLNTAEGKAKTKQAEQVKATNKQAQALVNSPEVTVDQIDSALKTVSDPGILLELEEKRKSLELAGKIDNLNSVNDELLTGDIGIPDDLFVPENVDPSESEVDVDPYAGIDPAQALAFGLTIPMPDPTIPAKLTMEDPSTPAPKQVIEENAIKEQVKQEYTQKNSVKTWFKRFLGYTNPDGTFTYQYSPTGEYMNQMYFNNLTGEEVPFNQVFASTAQGIPLVDTPLVQEGDRVELVVENDFKYTVTKGWKPGADLVNQVINIYRVNEQGKRLDEKPLLQLTNADNTYYKDKAQEKELNLKLRSVTVNNGGRVITTITNKNLGTVRRSQAKTLSSLAILENDWMGDSVKQLPYSPPLGYLDFGTIKWNNLGQQYPQALQNELLNIKNTLTRELQTKAGVFTARRTPKGDFGIEFLEGRRLSEQEVVGVRPVLDEAFATNNFDLLKDVIHVKKVTSKKDLFSQSRLARLNDLLAVPVEKTKNDALWLITKKDGTQQAFNKSGNVPVTPELKAKGEQMLNLLIKTSFRNVNASRLNSTEVFTDPLSKIEYTSYYEFLKSTGTLQTELMGTTQIGTSGQDNSYSYAQSTIYLDPNPTTSTVDVDIEQQTIRSSTIEFPVAVDSPTPADSEVESARRRRSRAKLKPATVEQGSFKAITSTELSWMKAHFGEEFFQVAKNVDRFIAENGRAAFGQYVDGLVKIAEFAPEGTGYHEFGHFYLDPINGLITEKQKEKVIKQAGAIFKLKNANTIEERILQEFEKYKLSNGKYKSPVYTAQNFFENLLLMIKKLLGLKTPMERLFAKIDGVNLTQEQKNRIIETKKKLAIPGDVRFKLAPGFFDYKQQTEAINAITSYLADGIYQASRDEGISIEEVLKQTYDSVKQQNQIEEFQGFWTREQVASQNNKVFLFGDNADDRVNTKYIPSSTQAVIRGLPNAIGIDTKKDRGINKGVKVQGENISSRGSEFAKKLTNVGNNVGLIYKGKQYINSEHAYQTWKSGEFNQQGYDLKGGKVKGGKIGDTFSIMVDILTEKLKQHPELIKGINERGGLEYVKQSTHDVIGDKFWESIGQNKFIEALYQSSKNVGIKNNDSSYFTDADFDIFKQQVDEAIQKAKNSGKTIVIPADGIGTGKAMLKEKAPKLFNYLQQELGSLKQSTQKTERTTKIDGLFNSLLEKFKTDYQRIAGSTSRSENDGARFDTYHAMGIHTLLGIKNEAVEELYQDSIGDWLDKTEDGFKVEGFKSKVLRAFSRFGLVAKNDEVEPGEDGDSTDTQATQMREADENERIFDQNITLVNPSKSLSQRIKLWLHSIPVPIIDENGKLVGTEKNIFGEEVKLDFNTVDKKLKQKLSDVPNILEKLQQLAEVDPIMTVVYNKLIEEQAKGPIIFKEFMVKYDLASIEAKTVRQMSQDRFDPASQQRYKTYETRVIDSNRDATFRMVVTDWRDTAAKKKIISYTDVTNKAIATKLRDNLAAFKKQAEAAATNRQAFSYETYKAKFLEVTKQLGITMPNTFWTNFELIKTKNPKKAQEQQREKTAKLREWLLNENKGSLLDALDGTIVDDKPLFESQAVITLAKQAAPFAEVEGGAGTYIAEDGTQRNSINLKSFILDWGIKIKTDAGYIADLMNDSFYASNRLLQLANDQVAKNRINVVEVEASREDDKDAKMFSDRTKTESIVTRFNSFFYTKDSNWGLFYLPTPSDKSKSPALMLPKKNSTDAKVFYASILKDTVLAEADRIRIVKEQSLIRPRIEALRAKTSLTTEELQELAALKAQADSVLLSDVKNLKNRGLQFQYLPILNENQALVKALTSNVSKGEISAEDYKTAVAQLPAIIEKYINDEYTKFENELIKNNIIKKSGETLQNNKIPKGIVGNSANTTTIRSFLQQFMFNDTAWGLEMSKVFMGDLALYKDSDDYFKRAYQLVTPGYKGFEETPSTLVRGVYASQMKLTPIDQLVARAKAIDESITEEEIRSEIVNKNSINPVVRVIAKYAIVNKTDAQTYADIHTYRTLSDSLGQWSKDHEWLYQNAWKKGEPAKTAIKAQLNLGLLTEEQASKYNYIAKQTILTPLKPFQFNDVAVKVGSATKFIKEQVKDSITPILPELYYTPNDKTIPGHRGFKDLLTYMETHSIGLMSAEDTVKVGSYGIIDLSSPPQPWQLRHTPISNLRYPQILPSKVKQKTSGSQFHKLILGNVVDAVSYLVGGKKMKGEKLKQYYNALWDEKLQESSKNLQELLGVDASFQLSTEPKELEKQLVTLKAFLDDELSSRDLDENYVDTLTLVRDTIYGVDFTVPLSFPQLGDKIQGILTNIFKREIIKQKSPGYVAVNLADFGTEKSDELKWMAKDEQTGELYSEIGLSIDYLNDIGLKQFEHYQPNGRVNWSKLNETQKQALEFIAYRIPTSSKSSMLPVRIAYILPSNMAGTVLLPGETTIQMGLDFDVDKTQLLRRTIKEGKIDKEDVNNDLFDIYWGVLTNKQHLLEVMTPLATTTLEGIKNTYEQLGLFNETKFSVFNMISNVNTEAKNKDEKAKVGINSRASTAHAVLQNIPKESRPTISFNIYYNGNRGTELGNMLDMDGNYISTNLDETQQAALDAAKTPLLALFNISKDYTALAESMLMAGYPLQVVTDFFMQPIIKEYINLYNQEGKKERKAKEALFKNYPEIKKILDESSAQPVDAAELNAKLTTPVSADLAFSASVLNQFFVGAQQAKMMATLTTVLSIDTYDDLTSIEAVQSLQHSINKLTGNESGIKLPASLLDYDTAPPETKRLAAFIKYGITNALAFTKQLYPSVEYAKYHALISGRLGISTITDQATLKMINQFINYYQLNEKGKLEDAFRKFHPLYNENKELDKSKHTNRWSFVKQDFSIADYLQKVVKEVNNDNLANNKLIKALKVKTNRDGIILLGLNNTGTDKNKTDIINAFDELLNAEDIRVRTLAHDLARYAIQTSGMSFSTASFVNVIPVSFFVENGLGNYWRTKMKSGNFDVDFESMFINLIRNKAEQIKGLPEMYDFNLDKKSVKTADGYAVEFVVANDLVKNERALSQFVIYKDNLYEQSPYRKGHYKLLQKAGEKYYTEITPIGREKSVINSVGSPDPWGLQSGVIPADRSTVYDLPGETGLEVENPLVIKYIPAGSTISSVLDTLIAEETDLQHLEVMQQLKANADKINSTIQAKTIPGKLGEFAVMEGDTGFTSTVSINPNAVTDSTKMVKRTLLHEIIHAFTVETLNNPKTEAEVNFNRNVERLTAEAKKKLGDVQGTKNKFEFVAELGSNKEFRSQLKGKDLWSRVIRNLRKLFNMKDSYDQLLDELYTILDAAQDLNPTSTATFNLEEKKEKKEKASKFADPLQSMLASLNAELKTLYAKGKKKDLSTIKLKNELNMLKILSEKDKLVTKIRYFIYVKEQLININTELAKLSKNPADANATNVQILLNQVLSYNDLLNQFYLDLRSTDEAEFKDVKKDVLLNTVTTLRNDVYRATSEIDSLYKDVVAQFIKSTLPEEDLKSIRENLAIADRDIGWWSRQTRSLVDVVDPALKAVALKLQEVVRNAYRQMYEIMNSDRSVEQTLRFTQPSQFNEEGDTIGYSTMPIKYKRAGKIKALKEYEAWRGSTSTIADKFAPVIDPVSKRAESEGVKFIDPLSVRGKEIRNIPEGSADYPLRQFYETYVLDYLHAQENIKLYSERPGLRIPTLAKSVLEGFIEYKTNPADLGGFMKDTFVNQFKEKSDEHEFAMVNQHLEPASIIPIRFTAKHDGLEGRYTKEQISMDIATSTLIFQQQMLEYKGKKEIQSEVELVRQAVKEREVIKTKSASILSGEVEGTEKQGGGYVTIDGAASNAFKALDELIERDLYGKKKKIQKGARALDFLAKVSGFNIMFGNVAIPITNAFMGNFSLFTEAIGGNIISATNLKNGYKLYSNNLLAYGKDFGKRANESELGKLLAYFNPLDQNRLIDSTGINGQFLRDSWNSLMSTGGDMVNHQLSITVMGAVMDKFKVTSPEGKEVAFNEGITITNEGKLELKSGYKYKGKSSIPNDEINKIIQYTLRVYHLTSGVYNQLDEGLANRDFVGRLVMFMRRWLPAGLDARYRRKFKDDRLGMQYEGQYVSAAIAFNRIYSENGYIAGTLKTIRALLWMGVDNPNTLLLPNELTLPQEEQQDIINLRKANIRKTLFQLYSIASLSLLLFAGEDDEDSYAQYLAARVRREMMTFMDPTTAWDVLRSPSVVMNNIQSMQRAANATGRALWNVSTGEEVEIKERGKGKGNPKWLYESGKLVGANALYQFDDLATSTRLIEDGGFR